MGTSNRTIPAVKKAFAAKASRLLSPASSRKRVLIPQMNEAARVLPSVSVRIDALDLSGGGVHHLAVPAGARGEHVPILVSLACARQSRSG